MRDCCIVRSVSLRLENERRLEPDQHIRWDKSVAGKIAHSFSPPFPWKTSIHKVRPTRGTLIAYGGEAPKEQHPSLVLGHLQIEQRKALP
jgi:hypothetical protein